MCCSEVDSIECYFGQRSVRDGRRLFIRLLLLLMGHRSALPQASHARVYLCYLFLLIHGPVLLGRSRRCFNKRYHQIKNRTGSLCDSAAFSDLYQSNLEPPRREESSFQQGDGGWS